MKTVLFICTHNSARSQMAEGFLNSFYGDKFHAFSAGIKPSYINPYVIKVMKEVGIDISKNRSKSIEEFREKNFDFVVTVCDHTKKVCPFFPGKIVLHKNFKNPAELKGSKKEILKQIRDIRDDISDWIKNYFGKLISNET